MGTRYLLLILLLNGLQGNLYGKTVTGYTLKTVDGKDYNEAVKNWKLFYADGTNIYLIADEFILPQYMPLSGKTAVGDKTWLADGNKMAEGYQNGSNHITDPKIKALNNDYFNVKRFSSTEHPWKVVAYLLDTKIWENFKADSAEYAIGTPTLELFIASFNQKYNDGLKALATGNLGYKIAGCAGVEGTHFDVQGNHLGCLPNEDTLYVAKKVERPGDMWIATPADTTYQYKQMFYIDDGKSRTSAQIMHQEPTGTYGARYAGLRPVVCLKERS